MSLLFFRSAIGSLAVLALTALYPINTAFAQTLANALDAPQLNWTTGGNQSWVGQTTVRQDGVDAARSGAVGNSQQSWLETIVTGPGTLVFWWKVSSEAYLDFLEFQVNGSTEAGPLSGEVDWQKVTLELGAGTQTLRWRYYKDPSDFAGQDRGWVDYVRYIPEDGPPVILNDPLSRTAEVGARVTFEVDARGSSPLNYQWYHGTTPVTGAVSSILTLDNVATGNAGQYTVRVQNSQKSVTSAPALLTVIPATLDSAFDPATDGSITALAVQPDGKILVGGNFDTLEGQPRASLGRLHADGSLDTSFNAGVSGRSGTVTTLSVQSDGGILVGGSFAMLGGATRDGIGRLNPDGSVDTAFVPDLDNSFSASVDRIVLQADGKILIAGGFSTVGGQRRDSLARLNANGTLDTTFANLNFLSGAASSVALQSNGQILVGGEFTILVPDEDGDLIAYSHLVRLGSNGAVDENFYPDPDGSIDCIAVQPDGKILISGGFNTMDRGNSAIPRSGFARIDANSNVDVSFNPGLVGRVYSIMLQADGKILVGGNFTSLGGQLRDGIGRLNSNGTIDTTFVPSADRPVESLAVQGDGKILVGGGFTTLGGQPRVGLGRLNATTAPTQTLNHVGTTITWLRGGTSPEVWRTTFEHSANGTTWTSLGAGTRIAGGWQRAGASVPAGNTIRARGYVVGGYQNASGSIVESIRGKPIFLSQPTSRTNGWGSTAVFTAAVIGSGPMTLQWQRSAQGLANGGNLSGANSNTLTLSQVSKASEGPYRLVVSNSFGSVTSLVATLTVLDPGILQHPVSANRKAGETVAFTVTAVGSPILNYQWYQGANQIAGATSPTLTLQNLTADDSGSYSVVVSNNAGSVTSSVATLTVLDPVIGGQPTGAARNAAESFTFTVSASGSPPLRYQWYHDGAEVPGAVGASLALQNLAGADAGFYRVVVSNPFGSVTSTAVLLTVNLATLDSKFDPGTNISSPFLALQADGKILAKVTSINLAGDTRTYIGRLQQDGTLDSTFNPGETSSGVNSLVLEADGKILVGGSFTSLAGQTRNYIGRLQPDGFLDSTFNPGASSGVNSLVLEADGKILVGGFFTNLAGQTRKNLGRLQPNGTPDINFDPRANGVVYALAVQADGKILVGGTFSNVGGQPRSDIARLHADGTLDITFNPGAGSIIPGGRRSVNSLAVQADGKIVVGGNFTTLASQTRNYIGRLHPDGTLESTFNPGANGDVRSLALQTDGKILVGGRFYTLGGRLRPGLGRLNSDGTIDDTFNPGLDVEVNSLGVQADGNVLVGGSFTITNSAGEARSRIARLNNTGPATQTLNFAGDTITWLRGGTSPEVWRTTFEHSLNGSTWASLGAGTRVPGGWQLTGAALPKNATVRARGFVSGGYQNSSSWFVESFIYPNLPIQLNAVRTGGLLELSWTAGPGPFQVQRATNLSAPVLWQDFGGPVSVHSLSVPIEAGDSFWRVRLP